MRSGILLFQIVLFQMGFILIDNANAKGGLVIRGKVTSGVPEQDLSDVLIYVKDIVDAPKALPPCVASVVKGKTRPDHLCVELLQPVTLRWSESELYVIKAKGNNVDAPAHGSIYLRGQTVSYSEVFTSPDEGIELICQRAEQRLAFVTVVSNRWHVFAKKNGEFELPAGVPKGTWELRVYHPLKGFGRAKLEVNREEGRLSIGEIRILRVAKK